MTSIKLLTTMICPEASTFADMKATEMNLGNPLRDFRAAQVRATAELPSPARRATSPHLMMTGLRTMASELVLELIISQATRVAARCRSWQIS
jgi:hypothetical protein